MNQYLAYAWQALVWLWGPISGSIAGRITPADLKRIVVSVGLMTVSLLAIMATGTQYAAQLMLLVATGLSALQSAVQRLLDGKPLIAHWFDHNTVVAVSPDPVVIVAPAPSPEAGQTRE